MNDISIELENVTKVFARRLIFKNISQKFIAGNIYGIAGSNGSGKSTLSRIIAGIISPTKGKIRYTFEKRDISEEKLHEHLGFVSPYLVLYDEFSAEENLLHFYKIRGLKANHEKIESLLKEFKLFERRHDLLGAYSSGMKQRMKFIFALIHEPGIIILDEPTSNLDEEGKKVVYDIISREAKQNIVLIASNERGDLNLCTETLHLEQFKNN